MGQVNLPHSVAGGLVAVKVLRALVKCGFKWNFAWLFWFFSNSIGLAKPNKCERLFPSAIYDLPERFVLRCCLIWYGFLFWPTKRFVTLFSIVEKSLSSRAGKEEGNLLPTTVFWDCLLSLSPFLFLSCLFVYLRYAYTSIIQMRSQQEASGCGLSRGLAQAALNPFSAFPFAFTFALLCLHLSGSLPWGIATAWGRFLGSAWQRVIQHAALMDKLMGKQFHAFCNGSRVAVANGNVVSMGQGRRGLIQFKCVCVCENVSSFISYAKLIK